MSYLGIDTSDAVAVAVVAADGTTRTLVDATPRRHVEHLAPLVERALAEAGTSAAELRGIAVGTGPAPFTGLRVGLVTARVLGLARGVPVWGVPSLDALAATAAAALPDGTPLLVVTDARRHEVYWARYVVRDGGVDLVAGPDVAAPADVPRADGEVVVGGGRDGYPDVLGTGPLPEGLDGLVLDPARLVALALARRDAGADQPVDPLYLRRPDAQPPTARKRVLA